MEYPDEVPNIHGLTDVQEVMIQMQFFPFIQIIIAVLFDKYALTKMSEF